MCSFISLARRAVAAHTTMHATHIAAAAAAVLLGCCGSRARGCAVAEASTFAGIMIAPNRRHHRLAAAARGVQLVVALDTGVPQ